MTNETLSVAYIGNKQTKTFRGYRIERMGKAEVPKEVAIEALKYPDVFIPGEQLDAYCEQLTESIETEDQMASTPALELMSMAIDSAISEGVEAEALRMAVEQLTAGEQAGPGTDAVAVEEGEEEVANLADESDDRRQMEIVTAILSLNPDDTENDFTQGGKPRVSAVERVLGFDVTAQEVADAFTSIGGES